MSTPNLQQTAVVLFSRTAGSEGARKRFGLGEQGDLCLGRALLRHTLRTLGSLPATTPVVLITDGPIEADERALLGPRRLVELRQRGDDFESRLLDGLRRVGQLGYQRLLAIGSDTPGLRVSHLRAALCARPQEYVVGDAVDGGLYLLALPTADVDRLAGLPWCSDRLRAALERRLVAAGVRARHLAPRSDVDSSTDVRRLRIVLERLSCHLLGRGLGAGELAWHPVATPPRLGPSPATSTAIRGPPMAACCR